MPTDSKSSPNKEGKGSGASKGLWISVLKFVFAVLLLPAVIGTTRAFLGELLTFEPAIRQTLLLGVVSYIIMKFFVYDFSVVYAFGQGIITAIFQFFKPLVNFAPYVLPVYTFAIIVVYGIFTVTGKMGAEWQGVLIYWLAFTFTMHIVLTAQDLYNKDSTAGKPNYFFGMSLVYIVDVFLVSLFMSIAVQGFSFPRFFQTLTGTSVVIYKTVFQQLF